VTSEPPAPEPQAPEPQAPEPQAPEPQAPEPQAPEPQAPEPQAPEPQVPEPQVPARSAATCLSPAWVLLWAAVWLLPFGVFQSVLIPRGFGMFGSSWLSGLWFALCTLGGAWIMRRELRREVEAKDLGSLPLVVCALTLLAMIGVGFGVARALPISNEAWTRFQDLQLGLIRLDLTYFAVKLPELCFQQTLMVVLVRRLQGAEFRGLRLIGVFALLFGSIHLPLIAFKGLAAVPFIVAATGAASLFVPLIAWVRRGVFLSFSVHLAAYLVVGSFLRATY